MPTLDMPLGELKNYNGISPRPDDFDEYWTKSLEEMGKLDSRLELKPASFQSPLADCLDLTFRGMDGARIYAKYLRPKNITGPCPVIFF
ncbi:MAG: acetylxylan esterase, partial [Spirochaetales bacterium]|nr:acetylxylan esterase [Spirochaetales bacterium]